MEGEELKDEIFLAGALFHLYVIKLGPVNIMKVK